MPFCRTRCRYCDFYRVGENRPRLERFLVALEREFAALPPEPQTIVDTVFFGGGTPSLLTPEQVASILGWLGQAFPLGCDAEVSLEANPSDLGRERLADYRAAGVNRLSLGVQSLCDRELRLLGRRHDAERAADCVDWARSAGFLTVSIDLMAAIPGQTAASFRRTLERAIELALDHLSLYLLEIHSGTEMDVLRRERPGLFPADEGQRRRYLLAAELLTAAGYRHYEVSNFCRPGRECRHNLKYWRREDVLGLGPAAHSCRGSRRWHHPPDLERYLRDPGARLELPSEPEQERVFLGLRLADGVPVAAMEAAGVPPRLLDARVRALEPFLTADGSRLRLTREGFVLSTSVIAELLAPAE